MKRQTTTAKTNYLYARLSKEDERFGESMSVENQRKILTAYAEENGITPYEFVADDGFSGSDWERPGLTGIIEEVEAGNVACLITKDA